MDNKIKQNETLPIGDADRINFEYMRKIKEDIKSGVYAIINNIDGGMYIGSSKNIKRRFKRHISFCKGNKGETGSYNLKEAVKKFGINNFTFKILEYCNENELLKREKYWIEKMAPTYNVSTNPFNPMGSRIKDRMKPKSLWIIKGHKQSDETRRKISKTMKGKSHSEKCLQKAREMHKKKVLLKIEGGDEILFDMLTDCANFLGISVKHASLIKHDKTLFRKLYRIEDYEQVVKNF